MTQFNIINNSNFIRIIYSNSDITFNGIYLLINFKNISCEKYFNKYKINFCLTNNKELLDNIKKLEENILNKYNSNKIHSYKIIELLRNGIIKVPKLINNSECSFMLKISGLWESEFNYGLAYKLILVDEIKL